MIYQKNGISVSFANGVRFRLDPKTYSSDAVNLVSHGHSDHLPSRCNGKSVVMSRATQALLHLRKRASADILEHQSVRVLDAGHVIGSHMFLLEGDYRLLYTGDFCTKEKFFSKGAQPVDTDVLIIESTFGSKEYVFPATDMVAADISNYITSRLDQDESVVVLAYPFGKAQELTHMLSRHVPFVDPAIYKINEALSKIGYPFEHRQFGASNLQEAEGPFVLITTGYRSVPSMLKSSKKVRTIAVSGWAINNGFRYYRGVDQAFALSDHADFRDLINFVERCNPEVVFTCHGFAHKFAHTIREQLGIDAIALETGQHILSNYV